jgi:hypothetical protein
VSKSFLPVSGWLLLAAAAGVSTWLLLPARDSPPIAKDLSSSSEAAPELILSSGESPAPSRDPLGAETRNASSDQTTASNEQSSEFSVSGKQHDFDSLPITGVPIDHAIDDPNAVIGRPFPISESVSSGCEREGSDSPCMDVVNLLTQMAEEPRDLRWAKETEAGLQAWLSQSSEFTIRAIECRTTLCAVEVSSIHGPLGRFRYGEPPDRNVINSIPLFGYETNPSSARVTVTVRMFKRRVS